MNWKPVLIGGPLSAMESEEIINLLLPNERGAPPHTLRLLEPPAFDVTAHLDERLLFRMETVHVYHLVRVIGATAFYEFMEPFSQ